MKTAVIVIVALLAGLVLGSWSVKVDLRRAEQEADSLRKELSRRPASSSGRLSGLTSMLKIPEDAEGEGKKLAVVHARSAHSHGSSNSSSQGQTTTPVVAGDLHSTNENPVAAEGKRHDRKRGDLRKQLETAGAVWKARSDLARAGFISTVADTDVQAIQFDVSMAAMNLRMSNSVRTWVESVRQKQEINSEDGIKIMNDLSGALVQAYNDLDRTMPSDWRTKAGSAFEVVNFINPEVVMPLTEIEDVLKQSNDTTDTQDTGDAGAP
jgi:hypothetical protein